MTRVVAPYDTHCDDCGQPIRLYSGCIEDYAGRNEYGQTMYWTYCLACKGTDAERDEASLLATYDHEWGELAEAVHPHETPLGGGI